MRCEYCGSLDWTIERYGIAVHKEACPFRETSYHQGNPPIKIMKTIMEKSEGSENLYKLIDQLKDLSERKYPNRKWSMEFYYECAFAWINKENELKERILKLEDEARIGGF